MPWQYLLTLPRIRKTYEWQIRPKLIRSNFFLVKLTYHDPKILLKSGTEWMPFYLQIAEFNLSTNPSAIGKMQRVYPSLDMDCEVYFPYIIKPGSSSTGRSIGVRKIPKYKSFHGSQELEFQLFCWVQ